MNIVQATAAEIETEFANQVFLKATMDDGVIVGYRAFKEERITDALRFVFMQKGNCRARRSGATGSCS